MNDAQRAVQNLSRGLGIPASVAAGRLSAAFAEFDRSLQRVNIMLRWPGLNRQLRVIQRARLEQRRVELRAKRERKRRRRQAGCRR